MVHDVYVQVRMMVNEIEPVIKEGVLVRVYGE